MKLKTLKDLEIMYEKKVPESPFVHSWRLKAEAIKWVKEILKTDEETLQSALSRNTRVSWIKYFFNITEDDLK